MNVQLTFERNTSLRTQQEAARKVIQCAEEFSGSTTVEGVETSPTSVSATLWFADADLAAWCKKSMTEETKAYGTCTCQWERVGVISCFCFGGADVHTVV